MVSLQQPKWQADPGAKLSRVSAQGTTRGANWSDMPRRGANKKRVGPGPMAHDFEV